MSQGATILPTTGTITGAQEQGYINTALAALRSNLSGGSAPSADTPVAWQFWLDNNITPGIMKQYDGADWNELWRHNATTNKVYSQTLVAPRGFWSGVDLANNGTDATNDIDFAPGGMVDSAGTYLMDNIATMTKQIDATWAAGNNAGGRFSGVSLSTSTWYHCYMIRKDSDGTIDFGFDTSATAANKPAGYSNYRYRGSVYRDSGGVLKPFFNKGDEFIWKTSNLDNNGSFTSGAWTNLTLLVPLGFVTMPYGTLQNGEGGTAGSAGFVGMRSPGASDPAPATDNGVALSDGASGSQSENNSQWGGDCLTNTSSQVELYCVAATPRIYLRTRGWRSFL